MSNYRKIFNELLNKDLKIGDKIENINPDCEHYKTKGIIRKIKSRPEEGSEKVKSKHNIPGSDVEYDVTNDTKTAEKGDSLKKSIDQIRKIK